MNYKGYSILHSLCRGWYVKVDSQTQWLAKDKQDAMKQVDEHISRSLRKVA